MAKIGKSFFMFIYLSLTSVTARGWDGYGLGKPERELGLGRQSDVLLAGQKGHRCARSGADGASQESALTARRYGTDQSSSASTAANESNVPVLVPAASATSRICMELVRLAIDSNTLKR
jgi:hypothetical protein